MTLTLLLISYKFITYRRCIANNRHRCSLFLLVFEFAIRPLTSTWLLASLKSVIELLITRFYYYLFSLTFTKNWQTSLERLLVNMNCQIPHSRWTLRDRLRNCRIRRQLNEGQFEFDCNITCPRVGVNANNSLEVIAADGECHPLHMDLKEHHTLPTPLMPPNTSVKCGRGIINL